VAQYPDLCYADVPKRTCCFCSHAGMHVPQPRQRQATLCALHLHLAYAISNRESLAWLVQWRRVGKTQCMVDNHICTEILAPGRLALP